MSQFNVTLLLKFGVGSNRMLNIKVVRSKIDLSPRNLALHFEGDDDVFGLFNDIQDVAIKILTQWIEGEMNEEMRKSVENAVNRVMNTTSGFIMIDGTHIGIDYGLILSPEVKLQYLPIAINGTGVCIDPDACKPYKGERPSPPEMMSVYDGKSDLQMLVSDYTLNMFFIAGYEDSAFNFSLTHEKFEELTNHSLHLDTDLFGIFIPEMKIVYGPHRNITINFNVTEPPKIDISKAGIKGILIPTLIK